MRAMTLATALLLGLAQGAVAQQPQELRQAPTVLARYADIPGLVFRSPYFAAPSGRSFQPGTEAAGFTTQAEMEAFLDRLGNAATMARGSLGRSGQGRDIPWLLFTAEGVRDFAAARALGRPVLWIVGLQHGNEPAGGEAALALAAELTPGGRLAELLASVTVVIVPRANPDGTALFTRDNAARADLNRDHVVLSQPETRGLHAAAALLPPDIILDLHEFTVGGRWMDKFGALYAADFVFQRATHPLVPPAATALAEDLVLPAIRWAAAAGGLSAEIYQTTPTARPDDRRVATGGNAPGIARNAFALGGAVSILLETRGIGIGHQSFQRRVASHVLAAEAVLRTVAAEPARVLAATAAARAEAASADAPMVVAHRIAPSRGFAPLIDPATGAPRIEPVEFLDARRIEPTVVRPRPVGFVLHGEALALRDRLALRGVALCEVTAAGETEADRFTVTERGAADARAINPDLAVRVAAARGRAEFPAGALFVPLAQPAAPAALVALDPDAPGGLIASGLLPGEAGAGVPVLRLPAGSARPAGLRAADPAHSGLCGG